MSIETISPFSRKLIDFKRREEVSGRGEGIGPTTWGRRNACEMRRAKRNQNARVSVEPPYERVSMEVR